MTFRRLVAPVALSLLATPLLADTTRDGNQAAAEGLKNGGGEAVSQVFGTPGYANGQGVGVNKATGIKTPNPGGQ